VGRGVGRGCVDLNLSLALCVLVSPPLPLYGSLGAGAGAGEGRKGSLTGGGWGVTMLGAACGPHPRLIPIKKQKNWGI
jgi:hypothetical protein